VPAEREQPELPVEPDEGLILPSIPEDPEHDRLIDPSAMRPEEGPRGAKAPRSAPGLPLHTSAMNRPTPLLPGPTPSLPKPSATSTPAWSTPKCMPPQAWT
jgi:hypothetical protein